METAPESDLSLAHATKRVLCRALAFFHNRAELLMVEIQEERERARKMIVLAAIGGVLGLLGGITLTAVIVVAAKPHYLGALAALAILYLCGALGLYFKVARLLHDWESVPGTRDQLQKDRECLEKQLA